MQITSITEVRAILTNLGNSKNDWALKDYRIRKSEDEEEEEEEWKEEE